MPRHITISVVASMISTHKLLLFCLAIALSQLVASCSPVGNEVNSTSVPVAKTNTSTVVPAVDTPVPSATAVLPSLTPLPPVKTQCTDNSEEGQKPELDGVVVLEKTAHQLNAPLGFYLMNPSSRNIFFTDNLGTVIKIASDGKHLAYDYFTPSLEKAYIRVMDSNGKMIAEFAPYYDNLWMVYFRWQNEKHLRIVAMNRNEVFVWLLNPFTQERTLIKTDWEGAYLPAKPHSDEVANWKFDREATDRGFVYGANILYDPTLTRVVFPKEGGEVALVDAQSGEELAQANFVDWGSLPSWSPNGEYLAILNREGKVEDFYLVSRDGEEFQRLTDFASEFDFVSIPEYTWSPDNQRIAFWLKLEDVEQQDGVQSELAILDVSTRQVTRLCIQGISSIAYEPLSMNHPEPIWSPDGRYLMITQWDDPGAPRKYDVLVIDTETGSVEKISENTAPIGWMIEEP